MDRIYGAGGPEGISPNLPLGSGSLSGQPSGQLVQQQGDTAYIDMGKLYGKLQGSDVIRWWPEPVVIDADKLDAFLAPLLDNLHGVKNFNLSFAQLSDIPYLIGKPGSSYDHSCDPIANLFDPDMQNHGGGNLRVVDAKGNTYDNILQYMCSYAHANNMKVNLSFGGESAASANDWKLPSDPKTTASDLVAFMNKNGLDGADFDVENDQMMSQNSSVALQEFFQNLHTELSSQGKQTILTIPGDINIWGPNGSGQLGPMFSSFDSINLMLYSKDQYYLDPDNSKGATWGLREWIQAVGDPSKLHIGFYDSIDYRNPSSSAGEKYNISEGATNGQAAAEIYKQLLSDLHLTPNQLGSPFMWTDDPTALASNNFENDFYAELNKGASEPVPLPEHIAKQKPRNPFGLS